MELHLFCIKPLRWPLCNDSGASSLWAEAGQKFGDTCALSVRCVVVSPRPVCPAFVCVPCGAVLSLLLLAQFSTVSSAALAPCTQHVGQPAVLVHGLAQDGSSSTALAMEFR